MRDSLGLTTLLYALGLGAALAGTAVRGRPRPPALVAGLGMLELAVVVQGVLDGVALVSGDHGPEVATNVGYLLTSVAVLPICATGVRWDDGRWGNAALAVGCLLVAVVSVRLHVTLGTSHA
ncbi:hypothetical protein ACIB24_16625 [Spongisporangium articulatum]|uniref:Integral membrane protein n=1 Tax=Spongisporangium articulatum TaxID=3362603 RepID=A0ABW8AS35_9ACTN